MTQNNDYEVSSESAVRHWLVPYARLTNTTPDETEACELTSLLAGTQVGGTVLEINATDSTAIVDFTCSMIYEHNVRNVLTYSGAVENTWGAINIGDVIYYDDSATMPAGVYLSTSPLDNLGVANSHWGYVAYSARMTYAMGGATASTQTPAVMQRGAGA